MWKRYVLFIGKLLTRMGVDKYFQKDQKLNESMKRLYPGERPDGMVVNQWHQIIAVLLVAIICLGVITAFTLQKPTASRIDSNNNVTRGEEDVSLWVTGNESGKMSWKKKMKFSIGERKLSDSEKKELDSWVDGYLHKNIEAGLQPESCPEKMVDFIWEIESNQWKVTASRSDWEKICYFDKKKTALSKEEVSQAAVRNAIGKRISEKATSETITLPSKVGNCNITYDDANASKDYSYIFLGLFIICILPLVWREKQKKKEEKRKLQMLCDHPEIVNRIMLLLGAGMTIKGAMERMVLEYIQQKERGSDMRYAYEEMRVCLQDINNGMNQGMAIENFGRRCQLIPYIRFSTIVTQNLKKGSAGIMSILEQDAASSFERRKEMVKQLGEEASTKLLFPMIIMLGLVMAIVLIPAFMTF
jgi:hypothetical protein